MATLLSNRYGKHRVRVLKVLRGEGEHEVCELEADVLLSGGQENSYHTPDNSAIVPTDTVKNTIHALAHDSLETCKTHFSKTVGDHFLSRYGHLTDVFVELKERRWKRMDVSGQPHPHSFVGEGNGVWFSRCEFHRNEASVLRAGLRDHLIMKTTGSGFKDYNVCDLTTLPPTEDRILATRITAEWTFAEGSADFGGADAAFVEAAYRVFAGRYSPSVQRTLFEIGEAFLEVSPSVQQVELRMPNVHFLGLDLSRLGRPGQSKVFLPTDEPHGEIEAVVAR